MKMKQKNISTKSRKYLIDTIKLMTTLTTSVLATEPIKLQYAHASSYNSWTPCTSSTDTHIDVRWVKVQNWQSFDELDLTYTGTGIKRALKETGCRVATPDTWYWMGFQVSSISATQCVLNATFRMEAATDSGACLGSERSIWEELGYSGATVFDKNKGYSFALLTGIGQNIKLDKGDWAMDGKDLSSFIEGMKYWYDLPYTVNHFGHPLTNELIKSSDLTNQEFYKRMTIYEHVGMQINHKPLKSLLKSNTGRLDIISRGEEYIIADFLNFDNGSNRYLDFFWRVENDQGELMGAIKIRFSKLTTPDRIKAEMNFDFDETTDTSQTEINIDTSTYLAFHVSFSLAPEYTSVDKFKFLLGVQFDNGVNQAYYNTHTIRNMNYIWNRAIYGLSSAECIEIATSANCSTTTHDFDFSFSSRSINSGFWPREEFPASLWTSANPTHDTKCWVKGASFTWSGDTSLCNHCKTFNSRNLDKTFNYNIQQGNQCVGSFNTAPYPDLQNCKIGSIKSPNGCDQCDNGYALNLNFAEIGPGAQACIPENQCHQDLIGMFYEEKVYGSVTKRYCTSCLPNCASCPNMYCDACSSSHSTMDPIFRICVCKIADCKNCTQTECDLCKDGKSKHIAADGTVTCSDEACEAGFHKNPEEVIPPGFSDVCRVCVDLSCKRCTAGPSVCEECIAPKVVVDGNCVVPGPEKTECRSPFGYDSEEDKCFDCSNEFDFVEKLKPGFCDFIEEFYFFKLDGFYDIDEKKRRFEARSRFFNRSEGEKFFSELTQEIFDNTFKVGIELEGEIKILKAEVKSKNIVDVEFQNFGKNLKIFFSLKNSTLAETYKSETSSIPIKALKNSTFTFDILNSTSMKNVINFSEQTSNFLFKDFLKKKSHSALFMIIITICFGIDLGGSMILSIQFLSLLDKIRFINIDFETTDSSLMENLNWMFEFEFFENQQKYSKNKKNKFFERNLPVLVYKKKIDKLIMYLITVGLDLAIWILVWKKGENLRRSLIQGERIGKMYYAKFLICFMFCNDVIFYCGYQILFSDLKKIFESFEFFFTYLISILMVVHCIWSIVIFVIFLVKLDLGKLKKIQEFQNSNPSFLNDAMSEIEGEDGNQEFHEINDDSKNFGKIKIIDHRKTKQNFKIFPVYFLKEITQGSQGEEKSDKLLKISYILKNLGISLTILITQNIPILQVLIIAFWEIGHISYKIFSRKKFKNQKNLFFFSIGMAENSIMINFVFFCIFTQVKILSKNFLGTAYRILTWGLLGLILLTRLVMILYKFISSFISNFKKLKNKENEKKIEEKFGEILEDHPFAETKFIDKKLKVPEILESTPKTLVKKRGRKFEDDKIKEKHKMISEMISKFEPGKSENMFNKEEVKFFKVKENKKIPSEEENPFDDLFRFGKEDENKDLRLNNIVERENLVMKRVEKKFDFDEISKPKKKVVKPSISVIRRPRGIRGKTTIQGIDAFFEAGKFKETLNQMKSKGENLSSGGMLKRSERKKFMTMM